MNPRPFSRAGLLAIAICAAGQASTWRDTNGDGDYQADEFAPNTDRVKPGPFWVDLKGNLWMANYRTPKPVVVLEKDGTWRQFSAPVASGECLYMGIDGNDYKWFAAGVSGGIYVFDSGDDLASAADDQSRILTASNSVLPSNRVNCFATDLDGDMWVGTDKGVCSFQCGSNIFDGSCTGSKIIINVDGFNSYLLANEEVRVIAIDGANRKWIGTTNGLFVFSPDGLTEIEHFTIENSPLFDNTILDVAIHPTSGDIWISTLKGLLTLRGEATLNEWHNDNALKEIRVALLEVKSARDLP